MYLMLLGLTVVSGGPAESLFDDRAGNRQQKDVLVISQLWVKIDYNLRQTFSVFIPPQHSNASSDQQFRHKTDLDSIVYSLTIKLLKPDCNY